MSQRQLEQTEIPGVETIGEILRKARKAKGVTPSQAAQATRMKIQHVEALEKNDFSEFAAPAYVKGFIKIYAEYLGLDPAPLGRKYQDQHAPKERAPLMAEDEKPKREKGPSVFKQIDWSRFKVSPQVLKVAASSLAVLLVIVVTISTLSRCGGSEVQNADTIGRSVPDSQALIAEPPAPYMDWEYVSK